MAPSQQTFQDHIHEFRRRLFWVIGTMGISAGVAYAVRDSVIQLLQKPYGAPLYYSSPGGGFSFVLKLSMIIGMFITLPVIIYELLRFLEPALPIRIKAGTMLKIIGASTFLAAAGIAFGYYYMIPQSLHFFGSFTTNEIKPLISADSYLTYVINNLVTFAIAFQIPLLILFINWIRPIKPGKLLKYQRHVIVGSFALALVLPFTYDPISQFMVAVPIIGLFYVSVILLFIANRGGRRNKKFAQQAVVLDAKPAQPAPVPVFADEPTTQNIPTPVPIPASALPLATADVGTVRRPRLSMDGMRGVGMRPAMAARVTPAPRLQQEITRSSLPQQTAKPAPVKPVTRGFYIDGFIAPQSPATR